jgi:FkbM family methyltransferase
MQVRLHLPQYLIRIISIPSPIEFFAKYGKVPNEILHVGAHLAEEREKYTALGIKQAAWVEAQPQVYSKLTEIVGTQNTLNTAVWSEKTTLTFKIARNSVSSSLLYLEKSNPWENLDFIDEIQVSTMTLDEVINIFQQRGFLKSDFFLLLDIQGAEFEALSGWKNHRSKVNAISCEVSKKKGYEGASRRSKIIIKMLKLGYIPSAAFLDNQTGHGDQLFIKFTTAISNPKIISHSFIHGIILSAIKMKNSMRKTLRVN